MIELVDQHSSGVRSYAIYEVMTADVGSYAIAIVSLTFPSDAMWLLASVEYSMILREPSLQPIFFYSTANTYK